MITNICFIPLTSYSSLSFDSFDSFHCFPITSLPLFIFISLHYSSSPPFLPPPPNCFRSITHLLLHPSFFTLCDLSQTNPSTAFPSSLFHTTLTCLIVSMALARSISNSSWHLWSKYIRNVFPRLSSSYYNSE